MLFDTRTTQLGQASLDALWLKTQVISNNMANVDTPGFKASSVSFEQVLAGVNEGRGGGDGSDGGDGGGNDGMSGSTLNIRRNAAGGSGTGYQARVYQRTDGDMRIDGNNVSLEEQQAELWKTYAQYSYLLDRIGGHYQNIGTAISNMRG